ncbi:HECT-domain-containing protein [Rhizopogon vinicolor AM-OR11-026]|uniref:HECT-type E3 ubiquitin transferase n=1 Tax=Rhizopogon vinicolor AM-OR11-026 TaxID=1314800 RepID=A0A1B7MVP3_9AGAM|nr:HECT-domain-containing protein [Rhizopogon vinicolor AM-OR11-026]
MLPVFGDNRRREINLGGSSSVTSQAAILNQARARRIEREAIRKRQESAVTIQAWWRGISVARRVRQQLREQFTGDVTGLTGLRCLVLIGQDDDVLDRWATEVLSQGSLFSLAGGADREHWLVLMRQVTFLLLRSVSDRPRSERAVSCLQVLCALFNSTSAVEATGSSGNQLTLSITEYAVQHEFYQHLSRSIQSIGPETKNALTLPYLVELIYRPLITLERSSQTFLQCFQSFIIYILTIPLLPNRIPLSALTALSSKLPLSSLSVLSTSIAALTSAIPLSSHVHLIANLYAFTSPRYATLPLPSLKAYLQLMTASLSVLPVHALDPPSDVRPPNSFWADDSDSETHEPQVTVVASFSQVQRLPQLDARTQKRLQTLPSPTHLNALLKAAQQHRDALPDLVAWLVSLWTIWPTRRDKILSTLLLYGGGGLVREIWRDYVRSSPLGKEGNMSSLMDPSLASAWPPLLLLTDMYTQSLLTMGDDEFFSNSRTSLTLDELVVFSRTLFNIAFTLYWRYDQTKLQDGTVPGLSVRWEGVRDKITKCLQAIHARDSRKPFMPEDHWHVSSQIDMNSFVDVAVFEEQQLDESSAPRAMTKRQLSYHSPRLGVLNNIPFAIPFETRVLIFRRFVQSDKRTRGDDGRGRIDVSIRRGHIAQDGYDRLADVDLRARIHITFIDQFGEPEAGIDGGGVFKEFFTSLCKEVFDTDRGLWLENKRNEIYPNPHSYATEPHSLSWYRFIGRILGKALYKGILIDVAFAGFFLAKWLDKQSFLDDLASLDPDLYQGLIFLKNYTGNVDDLALNFTIATEDFGVAKAVELIPDGSNVPVTRENRLQYIYLTSHYRLSKQIKLQSEAFFEGLSDMIDPKWLRMFNQQELQILLGGVNAPVDVQDLRAHTQYGGLYGDDESTIQMFWKVLEDFDPEQRRMFLRFVTSCSRPPLLGFKQLNPLFAIRDAGSDEHRLPTASTCVNLLKMPRYQSEKVLRDKLLQAISSGAGFDLS